MSSEQERFRVPMLDDYQNVALSFADWSVLDGRATVTVFNDHIGDSDAVVERPQPFDIVCVMRERTPMTRSIIERLPKLRLIAQIGNAFGMRVIAGSQNLTTERAAEVGAALVSEDELSQEADVVTVQLVLSGRTRGLIGAAELALMKPTARLVNTWRGPIVVEAALIAALKDKKITDAAIDVFDQEPLPLDHPLRALQDLLATPHIGYISRGLYARFYQNTVAKHLPLARRPRSRSRRHASSAE